MAVLFFSFFGFASTFDIGSATSAGAIFVFFCCRRCLSSTHVIYKRSFQSRWQLHLLSLLQPLALVLPRCYTSLPSHSQCIVITQSLHSRCIDHTLSSHNHFIARCHAIAALLATLLLLIYLLPCRRCTAHCIAVTALLQGSCWTAHIVIDAGSYWATCTVVAIRELLGCTYCRCCKGVAELHTLQQEKLFIARECARCKGGCSPKEISHWTACTVAAARKSLDCMHCRCM